MKRLLIGLIFTISAPFAGEFTHCIYKIRLVNEGHFSFTTYHCAFSGSTPVNQSGWYHVRANLIGATMFDKAYAHALLSLNQKLHVYGVTDGSNNLITNFDIQAKP